MVIPNIWKNKINVPNRQPAMFFHSIRQFHPSSDQRRQLKTDGCLPKNIPSNMTHMINDA
jgi:hypothetical protein